MSLATDRRQTYRQKAVQNVAALEWWSGTEPRQARGRVLDVSRSGLRFQGGQCPPTGQPAWLRVGEGQPSPWVSAFVVWKNDHQAGLAFRDPCPEDVYLALTLGIDLGGLFL